MGTNLGKSLQAIPGPGTPPEKQWSCILFFEHGPGPAPMNGVLQRPPSAETLPSLAAGLHESRREGCGPSVSGKSQSAFLLPGARPRASWDWPYGHDHGCTGRSTARRIAWRFEPFSFRLSQAAGAENRKPRGKAGWRAGGIGRALALRWEGGRAWRWLTPPSGSWSMTPKVCVLALALGGPLVGLLPGSRRGKPTRACRA